jgi:hypothetical protein
VHCAPSSGSRGTPNCVVGGPGARGVEGGARWIEFQGSCSRLVKALDVSGARTRRGSICRVAFSPSAEEHLRTRYDLRACDSKFECAPARRMCVGGGQAHRERRKGRHGRGEAPRRCGGAHACRASDAVDEARGTTVRTCWERAWRAVGSVSGRPPAPSVAVAQRPPKARAKSPEFVLVRQPFFGSFRASRF